VVTFAAPAVTDRDDLNEPVATCAPSSGNTFAVGTTTVTCSASDPDDTNSPVSTSFTISVVGAPGQLTRLAQAVQGIGSGTSLSDKVIIAEHDLDTGDIAATCTNLSAFTNQVKAQVGKKVPADTASKLMVAAKRIQVILGC